MLYENYYRNKSSREMDKDLFSQRIRIPITGINGTWCFRSILNDLVIAFRADLEALYGYKPP